MVNGSGSTRGPLIVTTITTTFAVAAFAVAVRLVARLGCIKNAGKDDLAIVIALCAALAQLVSTLFQVKNGLGQHAIYLSLENNEAIMRCLWVAIIFYSLGLCTVKLSIVLQYLRVFPALKMKRICWATIGLISIYGILAVLTSIWTCVPIYAFWTLPSVPGSRCISKTALWFSNAAFHIMTDLIVLILPMPLLHSLKLPTKQKIGLMCVFALGGFVCIVSALRLQRLYVVSKSDDLPYDNAATAIWSAVEVNTAIVCACMPSMKPVVSRLFPRLLSTNRSKHYGHTFKSQGRPPISRSTMGQPMQLDDMDFDRGKPTQGPSTVKTSCVVMSENPRDSDPERGCTGERATDIFVTTSIYVTEDLERKSDVASSSECHNDTESEKDYPFR
ncbi:hypothetical protein MBM_06390 [Drepanopeziza brunnea f. sp. 'multigermtubi' MB_m1]|uniref:Rhodopsin domain-containing protein n=1 Tax=Marssonina brunnea f. sp. multigermtubi (strain MB_m1) TaxID=1072389 RepID=K1XRG7_MARBU|nr:uncharacterized protein MBM_06390 [Drepanopeziza brunnea f. sp. 'multigermtubi' MB_m1]EKD15174.1 hypothetical protein MBM_06390 [Drepanopeziza brunnea f. sp. 'multigermtubi' MB_m1]